MERVWEVLTLTGFVGTSEHVVEF